MAGRECIACGNAEKYLRAGSKCRACRAEAKPSRRPCDECGGSLPDGSRPFRRYCSAICKHRAQNRRVKTRRPEGGFVYQRAAGYKARRRERNRASRALRRDEIIADKRAWRASAKGRAASMGYRQRIETRWRQAQRARRGSSGYSGSLEEYAEHWERREMGCLGARAWQSWLQPEAPKRKPERKPAMTSGEYYRMKYSTRIEFRLRERMRRQFGKWLKGERASKPSFIASLSYTFEELRKHIEARFMPGMSWENFGEWHVDHRIPKNLFDPSNADDVRACWALDNLRPLWKLDNLRRPKDGSDLIGISRVLPAGARRAGTQPHSSTIFQRRNLLDVWTLRDGVTARDHQG